MKFRYQLIRDWIGVGSATVVLRGLAEGLDPAVETAELLVQEGKVEIVPAAGISPEVQLLPTVGDGIVLALATAVHGYREVAVEARLDISQRMRPVSSPLGIQ